MNITIAGILLSIVLIITFIRFFNKPSKGVRSFWIITVFASCFLGVGYVFKLDDMEINYDDLAIIILTIYSFVQFLRFNLWSKRNFGNFIIYCIVLILGLIIRSVSHKVILSVDHYGMFDNLFYGTEQLVPMKVTSYSYVSLLRAIAFGFSLIVAMPYLKKIVLKKVINKFWAFLLIYVFLGYIELFLNNFVSPTFYRNIVFALFGLGSNTVIMPYYRLGIYSINLTTKEPSHVAILCFIITLAFAIESQNYKQKKAISFVMIFLTQLLSLSTVSLTSIECLFILLMIFWIYCIKKSRDTVKRALIIFLPVFVIFISMNFLANTSIYSYYQEKISEFLPMVKTYISNPPSTEIFHEYGGSVVFRGYSMLNAVSVFLQAPLFGCGIGTNTSMSAVLGVISNIGIIGTISFLVFFCKTTENISPVAFLFIIILYSINGEVATLLWSYTTFFILYEISSVFKPQKDKYLSFEKKHLLVIL